MATLAIRDIHGQLPALLDLLAQIRGECSAGDTVVFLGDYIDRGPGSKQCVDAILQFQREVAAEVVCLLGNHEDWMLQTMRDHRRHSWMLGMEALDTIRSYSAGAETVVREAARGARMALDLQQSALPYDAFFDSMPPEHVQFFERLRSSHRTADCVCSHGGLDPDVPTVDEQPARALTWGARGFPDRYRGGDRLGLLGVLLVVRGGCGAGRNGAPDSGSGRPARRLTRPGDVARSWPPPRGPRSLRRARSLRSKGASVARTKYRLKHLGHPTCLRKRRRFGLRHKPDFQHFGSIRALRTAHLFRFEHRHHIRSAISIAVVNDEFRPSEDADQTCEPNQEPGFLEHLAGCGVGRNFSRLYGATWQKPDVAEAFPDGRTVNEALRALIKVAESRARSARSDEKLADRPLQPPSRAKGSTKKRPRPRAARG